jgi:ssDNA-binding Zn-finger/Zn-ribbon topoisomerase 1
MHATDIIAWHFNGAAYCPDCKPTPNADDIRRAGGEPGPVFADSSEEEQGATCDACGACFDGEDWTNEPTQWATCDACNHQRPHGEHDPNVRWNDDGDAILPYRCPECGRGKMHFRS